MIVCMWDLNDILQLVLYDVMIQYDVKKFKRVALCCRYQGSIDWRDPFEWDCNGNESPYKELHNDGISLDPLETLFVKARFD